MQNLRKFILALVILGMSANLFAQPIFNHPQKSSYASEAEYPTISCQCHWKENPTAAPDGSNSQAIIDAALTTAAHTHFDVRGPIYSEITGLLRVPFTIKLFQTDGTASFTLDRQETVTRIEWDATGTDVAPIMIGDPFPHALMEYSGHFTIDPRRNAGGHGFPQRGWYSPQIQVNTNFTSGAGTLQLLRYPLYSMLDPNAPDGSLSGYPVLIASCYPHSPGITEWGTNYVEVDNFIPLTPISASWPLIVGTAAYGGNEVGDGIFEQRAGIDFHNGNTGQLLSVQREEEFTSSNRAPVLDPIVLGSGPHNMALIWAKPTKHLERIVTALLVFPVTVGPNVPPPTTCQDPLANNVGQPLPCTYNPTPPVEEWRPVTPSFNELYINNLPTGRFQMCSASGCKEIQFK